MQIIKRLALWCFFVIGGFALLGVLGAVIPYPFVDSRNDAGGLGRRILVVSNTIHTDIAVPLNTETLAAFGFLTDTSLPIMHPEARWLLIGWGGRSFYLETPTLADIKPGPLFRALTVDSSVMHVDVLAQVVETDPAVMGLTVTEGDYANLLAAISDSFARKDGKVQPIDGYAFGTSDKFFEAVGSFNALLGCNVWTSRILRSAGIRTGIWNPIPSSLTVSLGLFNQPASDAASPE